MALDEQVSAAVTGLALGRLRSPIKAAKGGLATIQSIPRRCTAHRKASNFQDNETIFLMSETKMHF